MMEILEAFDLVGTYRGAAALVGCDHKTVARLVELRDRAGGRALVTAARARPAVDPFVEVFLSQSHRSGLQSVRIQGSVGDGRDEGSHACAWTGSCAWPSRQGHRCAASGAGPCRAALDCSSPLG